MSVILLALFQQVMLGFLVSGVTTLADRADKKSDKKRAKALADLQQRLDAWKLPEQRADMIPAELAKLFGPNDPDVRTIADAIAADPLIARDLVELFLQTDAEQAAAQRAALLTKFTSNRRLNRDRLERFIDLTLALFAQDLGLAAQKQDKQFSALFDALRDSASKQTVTPEELQRITSESIERISAELKKQSTSIIQAICKELDQRALNSLLPISVEGEKTIGEKDNRLLSGSAPRQCDMRAGYAFERAKLPECVDAIRNATDFPYVLRIQAGPRRGKTTFAYQLAYKLLEYGYAAFECVSKTSSDWPQILARRAGGGQLPVVVIWDDPLKNAEGLKSAIEQWDHQQSRVVLITTGYRNGVRPRLTGRIRAVSVLACLALRVSTFPATATTS